MFKFILFFVCGFFLTPVFADNKCIDYKARPFVKIYKPNWVKKVGQPLRMMDLYHGNVVATLVDEYNISVNVDELPNHNGYCIGIKGIDATIGYSDFLVKIDMRHKVNSCSYQVVLAHEDEHIDAYLSVIDDFQEDLKKSVYSAANSIIPIYVENKKDIDKAINDLNYKLQLHPDLVLMKQRISIAEEIRNIKIDEDNEQYKELNNCNG